MTADQSRTAVLDLGRRSAASGALVLATAAVTVGVLGLRGDLGRALVAAVVALTTIVLAWTAATRRGGMRALAGALTVAGVAGLALVVLGGEGHGLVLVVVVALGAASTALSRRALREEGSTLDAGLDAGVPVPPARHGALIMNLRSGGGKAERFHLEDEARHRGIEAIVLRPGDDLVRLAEDAIADGADVIGMAGGDGSQALVASVAVRRDVPLVCVPAGTRNHFALDLGLDRDDVVGALDAFGNAVERRIDLATVGDRVFVNNVSLGVYPKIVQAPEYRDAKRRTTASLLPDLLGPDAPPFDLRFTGPDGAPREGAQIIQVSNNPYVLTRIGGFGSRARLDTGQLGIAAARVDGAAEVAQIVAAEASGRIGRFPGWQEWAAPTFRVESDQPIEAGVDGEALLLEPPLEFRILPGTLRVRIPGHARGRSPAALTAPSPWWTVAALVRATAGRPTPVDPAKR